MSTLSISHHQKQTSPLLPDDIIIEVFSKSNSKIVGPGRILSTSWKKNLMSADFLLAHLEHAKKRSNTIYILISSRRPRSAVTYLYRLNVQTGFKEALDLPFMRNNEGQFEIIGSENGIMAVRSSTTDAPANLMWNPDSSHVSIISDVMENQCTLCGYIYAFTYVSQNLDFVWINIHKKRLLDEYCFFTTYSLITGRWDTSSLCPPVIQRIDWGYVSSNGYIYFLSWNNYQENKSVCVVSYSILTSDFDYILISKRAISFRQKLLLIDGRLCFLTMIIELSSYKWIIWEFQNLDGSRSWNQIMSGHGHKTPMWPHLVVGKEIIMVKEINTMVSDPQMVTTTRVRGAVNPYTCERRILNAMDFPIDVTVRSVHINHHTLLPVNGN